MSGHPFLDNAGNQGSPPNVAYGLLYHKWVIVDARRFTSQTRVKKLFSSLGLKTWYFECRSPYTFGGGDERKKRNKGGKVAKKRVSKSKTVIVMVNEERMSSHNMSETGNVDDIGPGTGSW
jgi:hypothetical protein